MNYHFIIDHWILDDFIEFAEEVAPLNNSYILLAEPVAKHVKSVQVIFAPHNSQKFTEVVNSINTEDKVYIHWFHDPIMDILKKLQPSIPVYLIFWGGDLLGQTEYFFNFNHDRLTKKYLRDKEKVVFFYVSKKPLNYVRQAIEKVKSLRPKRDLYIKDADTRKLFLKRLNFFCHWNAMDMEMITSIYGGTPRFLNFFYGSGLTSIPEADSYQKQKKDELNIWLGNSDTPANNHLDAFKVLSRYKKNNIKITCPLSYGFGDYGDFISKKGQEIFGNKWNGLMEFTAFDKYLNIQYESDVAVMYHNRTQASGNIFAFIKMGKKVFLKKQSTLYSFLKENNIVVFDANTIKDLSFDEFAKPLTPAEIKSNSDIFENLFSDKRRRECYKSILIDKN